MVPEVRIYVIQTAKEIIKDMGEQLTPERVIEVTNQLIDGMEIPQITKTKKTREFHPTQNIIESFNTFHRITLPSLLD